MYDGITLNNAIIGYLTLAARDADIPQKKIDEMINNLRYYLDTLSIDAAAKQK